MYYDEIESGLIGELILLGNEYGLTHIKFKRSQKPITPQTHWEKKPRFFTAIKAQLRAYFKGELRQFDIPLAPMGTAFQRSVWKALRSIPYGELVSYKTIAEAIGKPKAVRAVGGANGKNPIPIIVPCHRVIGSDGTLTGFSAGLEIKQKLIVLEKNGVS